MERSILRSFEPTRVAAGLAIMTAVCCGPASAYTPGSPEVRDAVGRAVRFLETSQKYPDMRPGAQAIAGLALLKNGARPNHPFVASAAAHICAGIESAPDPEKCTFDMYSTALSIIFLVILDKDRYGPEIDFLLRYLHGQQKPHGGWGYKKLTTGDTSMTQNALLCFWEANKAGVPLSPDMIDRGLIWLLKTQDPSGGFGYQGNVSNDFTPVRQSGVRPSMSGAGLGSLYVCADLLNVGRPEQKRQRELPPGVTEIKEEKRQGPARSRVDPRLVHQALARGKAWMDQNFQIENPAFDYPTYNLYTLERYHTFRELAEGNVEAEPRWYNDGVRYLLSKQNDDGSWTDRCRQTAATGFGILFLVRSTKISVTGKREFGDGTLVGGRGLPKYTDVVTVVQGKVIAKPELGALDAMLKALEDASAPDAADALAALAELPTEEAGDLVSKHAKMLQELAADESPEARLAAVRALGKKRNLDYVPVLIYALTDPDPEIVRAARDSLRRISRKFRGFGMPDNPTELERHTAIRKWQAWYLAIRPDAVLED
jgi:hypothetical protein